MICYPNAKINLGLNIVSKRDDGYHNLETVFLPVMGLCDELDITPADIAAPYFFVQEGMAVDCAAADNLIVRALMCVRERYPQTGNVHIRFRKRIPFGAGLGGGSADAAFTVRTLNALFGLRMTDAEMEALVSPLGADCAFFIQNRPRLAQGIGDVFSEVPDGLLAELHNRWLLLVKPDCAVSTREAYGGICPRRPTMRLPQALAQPIDTWQQTVVNDFETSVFPLFPEIAECKRLLIANGARYAAMSGSGATVFGIFDNEPLFALPNGVFYHKEQIQI